jgi:hypothetical protein
MPLEDLTPEQLAQAEAWDAEQAHREMDELEMKSMEGFAEIERTIRVSQARHKSVTLEHGKEKVVIRTRAAAPYALRLRIARFYQRQRDEGGLIDPDAEVDDMYRLMAEICLDAPWTDPKSWAYLDKMTGDTPKLFDKAVMEIQGFAEMMETFRGK